jgi:hypothetical protein
LISVDHTNRPRVILTRTSILTRQPFLFQTPGLPHTCKGPTTWVCHI